MCVKRGEEEEEEEEEEKEEGRESVAACLFPIFLFSLVCFLLWEALFAGAAFRAENERKRCFFGHMVSRSAKIKDKCVGMLHI